MTWWDTPQWYAYEIAYGDAPGTRSTLLASASWQTQVIDLTLSEAELWRGVRKSYKSLIHAAERDYEIREYSNADVAAVYENAIEWAMNLHETEAGRVTRPLRTWQLMSEWIGTGQGLMVSAWRSSRECVAFAYFLVHEAWSYYASDASLEDHVNHALIWAAMKALKARGVHALEMGWQTGDLGEYGREFFKRGFGGRSMPFADLYRPTGSA